VVRNVNPAPVLKGFVAIQLVTIPVKLATYWHPKGPAPMWPTGTRIPRKNARLRRQTRVELPDNARTAHAPITQREPSVRMEAVLLIPRKSVRPNAMARGGVLRLRQNPAEPSYAKTKSVSVHAKKKRTVSPPTLATRKIDVGFYQMGQVARISRNVKASIAPMAFAVRTLVPTGRMVCARPVKESNRGNA
jgi:hypothetical protein